MRDPNALDPDLIATLMFRTSKIVCPVDFASYTELHQPFQCTYMYTCHSLNTWGNVPAPIAEIARRLPAVVLATSLSGMLIDSASGGLLASSDCALAVTTLLVLIGIIQVKFDDSSRDALVTASHVNWAMPFAVHHSSTSYMLIVPGRGSWYWYSQPTLLNVLAPPMTILVRLCQEAYGSVRLDSPVNRMLIHAVVSEDIGITEADSVQYSAC